MKKLLMLCMLVMSACASNPNKVEKLKDVEITKKGSLTDSSSIGINSNNEAIIQSINSVEKELNGVVWWNNSKEMELNSEYANLKRCRKDLSDPRLGGAEKVKVPELRTQWDAKTTERTGLVGEDLVVVKEQYLRERLQKEKERGEYYDQMIRTVKDSSDDCESLMGQARVKAGLPSKRFQGKITITPDGKVGQVLERNENDLDDAFEIAEEKRQSQESASLEAQNQRDVRLEKAKNPRPVHRSWDRD